MCTRFLLLEKHYHALLQRLGVVQPATWNSRYNIAPTSLIPAVRVTSDEDAATVDLIRWGLVPSWAKSADTPPLVNARAESVAEKPSFRDALRHRRCVIPASGYYEWQTVGQTKKPWLIQRKNEEAFGFAGVWETWHGADQPLVTCAIITTSPSEATSSIHPRMPVMLTPEQCTEWLSPRSNPAVLPALLGPAPAETLSLTAISRRINSSRHDSADCLAPAAADEEGPQLSFDL
jgi:putative SOS response-associated peptidase YedK